MREKSGGILSVFAIVAIGGAMIGLKWSGLDLNLDHLFCQGLGNCFEEFVKLDGFFQNREDAIGLVDEKVEVDPG